MPELSSAPTPLPTRITPCSIVNAITEVRFQTDQSPTVVPGLVYSAVRDRFPKQAELGQAQIPDAVRAKMPELRYAPTVVMHGEILSLHVGPRGFFLGMSSGEYPGWSVGSHGVTACFVSCQSESKIEPTRASRSHLMATSTG